MSLMFDFWDNYQNMLDVIVWKKKFIPPVWDNQGVPLKIVKLSPGTTWALMSRVNGDLEVDNIEVVYSQWSIRLQPKAMVKLTNAYFELYKVYLTGEKPQ